MKKAIVGLLMLVAVGVRAQDAATGQPPSQTQIQTAIQDLTQSNVPGKWAGKLDFKTLSPGFYQSLYNSDSAYGVGLKAWHLDKGDKEVLNTGLFLGIHRQGAVLAGAPIKDFGGATFAIPGSALDWALGTNMGATWVPRLKTGIMAGYDLFRPRNLHARPDFVGFGIHYPVGL